jgi:hypothetical protein
VIVVGVGGDDLLYWHAPIDNVPAALLALLLSPRESCSVKVPRSHLSQCHVHMR